MIRKIVLMVLVVGAIVLIILSTHSKYCISRPTNIQTTNHHQRYRTLDQMRYILYGESKEFSLYDPHLLDYIRTFISLPSPTRPRKLARRKITDNSQIGQSALVDKILSGRRNGFFVECGAADGTVVSNSLFFEVERNWTGLLIEANPYYHRELLEKNRNAFVLRACLSTEPRPMSVKLLPAGVLGGIGSKMHPSHIERIGASKKPEVVVNCFPLNSIMEALEVSHVDYLSLDVEGPELEILQTVDWSRLRVDVITVEYAICGHAQSGLNVAATLNKLGNIRKLFSDTGVYREVTVLKPGSDTKGQDVVFSRI